MFIIVVLPGSPLMLMVSDIGSKDILIRWSHPLSNGGSPITHYIIEQRLYSLFGISPPQDNTNWIESVGNVSGSNSTIVASLNPYTGYQFRVIAVNVAGSGSPGLPSDVAVTVESGRCVRNFTRLCYCHPIPLTCQFHVVPTAAPSMLVVETRMESTELLVLWMV